MTMHPKTESTATVGDQEMDYSYCEQSQASEMAEDSHPVFYIGQHDSERKDTLTDSQYTYVLNAGFSFVTTPVTNKRFHDKVKDLVAKSLADLENAEIPSGHPGPTVPPLVDEDTTLFPSTATNGLVAYASPWIDLSSSSPVIASISRQVLNLEIAYANFCGVRSVIIPGPRADAKQPGSGSGVVQYARAIQELLLVGSRLSFIVHLPMYREPGLEESIEVLSDSPSPSENGNGPEPSKEIDLFSTWESWNVIRSVCKYDSKLYVALRIPQMLPETDLQTRWFSEPMQYLTFHPQSFLQNKAGYPALSQGHQEMIKAYMRLKNAPYMLLCDVGPEVPEEKAAGEPPSSSEFPTLAEAAGQQPAKEDRKTTVPENNYAEYLRHVERHQDSVSVLEQPLVNFQDWLQSPLQPLSDNLESMTYEVFEGDPVKYNQYATAIAQALTDWSKQGKPTSSPSGKVVVAVAGSGRGPLVTRALWASEKTGIPIEVWAVEKNPNAYVYLLRQNKEHWGGKVTVVKTDMRAWKGPVVSTTADGKPGYGKVDILISELLGSFGDNELSPECLDGIQHLVARPHGISIPKSYTAHLTPIATPRLHMEIKQRESIDPHAFETPWVVRLFQLDFVAVRVAGKARFQQAWEFAHPLPQSTMDKIEARKFGGVIGGGGGSMYGSVGGNEHNTRHCQLTFVCRAKGVVHGLAGYFESTLYEPREGEKTELSILPEMIERKSKDMISWFPILFPLKQPLYFPADTELEVSMWRQTDDSKVWYEWIVEAYTWVGKEQRIKIGASEMCSSRKVACVM